MTSLLLLWSGRTPKDPHLEDAHHELSITLAWPAKLHRRQLQSQDDVEICEVQPDLSIAELGDVLVDEDLDEEGPHQRNPNPEEVVALHDNYQTMQLTQHMPISYQWGK